MKAKPTQLMLIIILIGSVSCVSSIEKIATADRSNLVTVYLANYGWHTGLIIPQSAIPEGLWPERADFPDKPYLEIGWGDWDYYQTRNPDLWMTFKAALLPTSSVLYVTGRMEAGIPHATQYEILELALTREAFYRMCRYIHGSFDRAGSVRVAALATRTFSGGRFYPAQGRFHLLRTCNAWTAGALRAAGIPVGIFSALSASRLVSQARQFAVSRPCTSVDCNGQTMQPEPAN